MHPLRAVQTSSRDVRAVQLNLPMTPCKGVYELTCLSVDTSYFTLSGPEMPVERAAKWTSVIGGVGLLAFFIAATYFLNSSVSVHEDVDWNDWIVYEVEGSEATLYLDEDIGYTIYVDNSYSCSEVTATAYYEGRDYYEENCDPYYDFDNWRQVGDIGNDYSGDYHISVSADGFILVDWTTVEDDYFDYMLMSVAGCCVSFIILVIGLILTALTEKKRPETPQFVRDPSGHYRPPVE